MLRKLKAIVNKYLKPHKTEDQQKPEEIKLTEGQQKPEVSILEELKERVREYLQTHTTESQQEYGKIMMDIFSRPYAIPEVDPHPIKVIIFTLLHCTVKEADEVYDKLVKEIKEAENRVYTYVDPEMLERYRSK